MDVVPDEWAGGVESDALAAIGTRRVLDLLDGIGAEQRDVLMLRFVADLTIEQVAAAVGKSPGAVKQLQRRGLAAVRQVLAQQRVTLSASPAMT